MEWEGPFGKTSLEIPPLFLLGASRTTPFPSSKLVGVKIPAHCVDHCNYCPFSVKLLSERVIKHTEVIFGAPEASEGQALNINFPK